MNITKLENQFEGKNLTTITYKGRPCWIAREVGAAIGYSHDGKRFASNILNEWCDEFVEGDDFLKLEGEELKQFKSVVELGTDSVPSQAPSLLLIFESGLWSALLLTKKEEGRRLRQWLKKEVLPQINKTGAYLSPKVQDMTPKELAAVERLRLAAAKEERLDRQFRAKAMMDLSDYLHSSGLYNEDTVATYRVVAAEEATGRSLVTIKPKAKADWLTPTEIGLIFGCTARKVGSIVNELDIRENTKLTEAYHNKASNSDRMVICYRYSVKAVAMIKQALIDQGHEISEEQQKQINN